MDKSELRDAFIEIRDDLSNSYVAEHSQAIIDRLLSAVDWNAITTAHIYRSVAKWKEVDTSQLGARLKSVHDGIHFVYGNPSRSMQLDDTMYDVIIIPLLTFDHNLNRLGFGGGWYDRFLAKQKHAKKIGVAFDIQRTETIPRMSHDIPLDMVVTESKIFTK